MLIMTALRKQIAERFAALCHKMYKHDVTEEKHYVYAQYSQYHP